MNIKKIIDFIAPLGIKEVHILPFHQYGSSKYKALGKNYKLKEVKSLTRDEIEAIQNYIQSRGITAVVGGN